VLAIATYDWFLSFHALAAVVWVGGNVAMNMLGVLTVREGDPVRSAQFAKHASLIGTRVFTPASLVLLGLGFAMVENASLGYNHFFIIFGLVVWGSSFAVGAAFLGPQSAKLAKVLDEGGPEDPRAQALISRILTVARLDALLLLLVVFAMTAKPFS
jgi:uncharacterized membrane protein